ncbi:MAG: hypothetical protein M3R55_17005, partial [Acidobacteriota bacterium]|nr:hypothetical protein [Acidobacteriota bacterium]
MSIEIDAVGAIRAISESTFGADMSASLASFWYIPASEGTVKVTLTTDEFDPMEMIQSRVEGRKFVLGKRSATVTFSMPLAPTGTAAASGVTAVTSSLGKLLKAAMGAEFLGAGTTWTGGGTSSAGVITTQAGHAIGGVIGWMNAAGVVEWREIEAITGGNLVTVKHAFSGIPAAGNVAYGAASYSFTEDPSESLSFLIEGAESDDRWLLRGCQAEGGVSITLDPSGSALPTISFTFTATNYLESDETASAITGTLSTATYSAYNPIVGNAGELRVFTVGASTLVTSSLVHCSALAFNPKIAFTRVTSPSGANGGTVLRWRGARANPPIEGSITTYYDALTWFQARDSKADKAVFYTMGQAAGSQVMLSAPTCQIVNPNRTTDAGGIAAQTFTFRGRRDTDVG